MVSGHDAAAVTSCVDSPKDKRRSNRNTTHPHNKTRFAIPIKAIGSLKLMLLVIRSSAVSLMVQFCFHSPTGLGVRRKK